jgi:DNA uptake protein ComE-like DNA-binding protein
MNGARLKRGWSLARGAFARMFHTEVWTARQRLTLASILLAIIGAYMIVAYRRPLHIGDPQPVVGARAGELATRIDPNDADWAALAALPLIGEKRAKDIVAYREEFVRKNPGRRAFEKLADLEEVKGIGEGTAEALAPYLLLPK